jgi:hypothetical protein
MSETSLNPPRRAMGLWGWFLVACGLAAAAASAAPFVYIVASSADKTINPAPLGVLMVVGGFASLLVAAFGGAIVFKARVGKWPPGF